MRSRWRRLGWQSSFVPLTLLIVSGCLIIWLWISVFGIWLRVPWYPGQTVAGVYWRAFLFATRSALLALVACACTGLAILSALWRR